MARFLKKSLGHSRQFNKKCSKNKKCQQPLINSKKHNKNQKINKWNINHMKGAVDEYFEKRGAISVRQLARAWNFHRSTLQMRIDGRVKGTAHMSGRKPLFDSKAEDELVAVIKLLSHRGFPLGMKELRSLAYSYAHQNGIEGFSQRKGIAGYEWLNAFLKRHPELSIRKPEPLSIARACGMNRVVVQKWFESLGASIEELGIKHRPDRWWNVDETGLQDHFVPQKVVAEAGKMCYQATAGEKGDTITIVAAFNAVGTYCKPFVIGKGKRLKPEWLDGLPADFSISVRISDNGWINKELFIAWAELFVASLPKYDIPHVLFLDGHGSHVFNLEFINLMKQNNVHVWCFPAHTTHWLQPADRSLFRSLKHQWTEEGLKVARQRAGTKLSRNEFLQVFATTWRKAATVENAMSGFCSTGLFPFNPQKIPDEAFLPSITTERTISEPQLVLFSFQVIVCWHSINYVMSFITACK